MSTKNLARTVIEGGRYRGNRWFRRYSHKQERTAEQQLSNRVVHAELMQRFDTHTTGGRHIVFCHLIPSVKVNEIADRYRRFDFKVDRERWDAFAAPPPQRSI